MARNSWGRLLRILSREGVDPKVSGHFFKEVNQEVLLFGAETWVLTPRMERALSCFQCRVARRLTVRHPQRRGMGFGNTPHCSRQWWKQASKRLGHTSQGGRIRPHSILRRERSLTSMRSSLGGRGRGCLGSGRNRTIYIWRVEEEGRGGIGRRGGDKRGGENALGNDDGPGMRVRVQSSKLTYYSEIF